MATALREIEDPDIPIPVSQLIIGSRLPCDMFIRENNELKIFFNKDFYYTTISQAALEEKGISEVYIFPKDFPGFDYYLAAGSSPNPTGGPDEKGAYMFQKKCLYCATLMEAELRVCPNCKRRQGWNWTVIVIVIVLVALAAIAFFHFRTV